MIKRGFRKRSFYCRDKSGQLKISFGMIFSLVLIAFFIVLAFFVIRYALDWIDTAKTARFLKSLEDDVEKVYKGIGGRSMPQTYYVSKKVEKVCNKPKNPY